MYIDVVKEILAGEPDSTQKYIFMCEDENICQNIIAVGFNSVLLTQEPTTNVFSVDTFKEYICSFEHPFLKFSAYIFIPACTRKFMNDALIKMFETFELKYKTSGWQLFRNKEYLGNYEFQDEIRKVLEDYVERFDGSRLKPDLMQFHRVNSKGDIAGPLDIAIVNYILDTEDIFVIDGIAFIYENGVFKEDKKGVKIKSKIQGLLFEQEIKASTLERIYELLILQPQIQKVFDEVNNYPAWWINFKNYMFDVKEWKAYAHKPEYLSVNQIPHDFVGEPKKGECFLKFTEEAIPNVEDRNMIMAYIGYCMTIDASFQKFMTLKGDGGTGKSRIIALVQYIVGKENFCNLSITDIGKRFYPTYLFGKLLNACADIPTGPLLEVDNIKKVTGEDEILFERKGSDVGSSFKSYAKLLFSANEVPMNLDEKSNAFYRRMMILEMEVKPKKKDLKLDEKLEKEVDYVIWLACRCLRNAYAAGELPESKNSKRLVNELYNDADSVKAWIDDMMEPKPGVKVLKTTLYKLYKEYCEQEDRAPHGKKGFYSNLDKKGYKVKNTNEGRFIIGLTQKDSCFEAAGEQIPFA